MAEAKRTKPDQPQTKAATSSSGREPVNAEKKKPTRKGKARLKLPDASVPDESENVLVAERDAERASRRQQTAARSLLRSVLHYGERFLRRLDEGMQMAEPDLLQLRDLGQRYVAAAEKQLRDAASGPVKAKQRSEEVDPQNDTSLEMDVMVGKLFEVLKARPKQRKQKEAS